MAKSYEYERVEVIHLNDNTDSYAWKLLRHLESNFGGKEGPYFSLKSVKGRAYISMFCEKGSESRPGLDTLKAFCRGCHVGSLG